MSTIAFNSRRSPVLSLNGVVSSSQPLASAAGLRILQKGGNAADAAVAVSAALAVVEPCSTGLGGDCFALFFSAADGSVQGLNGSGRSSASVQLDQVRKIATSMSRSDFNFHAANVTVPGAAAGWYDCYERWGSRNLSFEELLEPAIELAQHGFPVGPVTSLQWKNGQSKLESALNGSDLLVEGKTAPEAGEIFVNEKLAGVLRYFGKEGKKGFYEGWIAKAIVDVVQKSGGFLDLQDLALHSSDFVEPISVNYQGVDVYEIPPNGQGITALIALNILKNVDLKQFQHNSAEYLHHLIEALRLAFSDSRRYVADPSLQKNYSKDLLAEDYGRSRFLEILPDRVNSTITHGNPVASSETISFCVADSQGNAISFVNSNYMGFGTGIVPENCGFTLQNRGAGFSLRDGHPNVFAPGKRPYHTIIPGMAVRDGQFCAFNVMGGFMQPQGHVQVISNMVNYGMDPQSAVDACRFMIDLPHVDADDQLSIVALEEGIPDDVVKRLRLYGHKVQVFSGFQRASLGRGQIILQKKSHARSVYWAGSEPRCDGCAMGW